MQQPDARTAEFAGDELLVEGAIGVVGDGQHRRLSTGEKGPPARLRPLVRAETAERGDHVAGVGVYGHGRGVVPVELLPAGGRVFGVEAVQAEPGEIGHDRRLDRAVFQALTDGEGGYTVRVPAAGQPRGSLAELSKPHGETPLCA